ncbi:NAD(P)/FAD-dependent oxidoreductase [Candidatus Micrarchaeota archaeon]|nr:NAD(P)/FAD-dependent oxidoreductase [Candidatus Micrarchaeota archaeon]MBU1166143.1 NAD(P)/FAD-dependent oxidoreductase [Candidatus Micrarchaeota archaeon]MBU1887313.1 NAD(P)/FAD-dependent oxidoreductase [Candidatus Micrarchaeota archaeon]
MSKVHIIGGGPAGSIAAISAVRNGHDVIVSEEHHISGIPENCSGLFSKDGLESLSQFIDYDNFIINPIYGADIFVGNEKLSVRTHKPVGFVCDRSLMDQELAETAVREGAKINYNEHVSSSDSFCSDNIIGADGPMSFVARYFGFSKIPTYASALQAMVDYHSESPGIVKVYLSNEIFPGFFGWIIPHDEYTAEIGCGVVLPNNISSSWNWFLKFLKIPASTKPKGAIIPIRLRPQTSMKKGKQNIILAGDAAGQVKATTGGGVIFGGNCAALAGKYATSPLLYETAWRSRYAADLFLHQEIHKHISGMSDTTLHAFGRKLRELHFDDYLSRHGHMDKPTRMLHPYALLYSLGEMAGVRPE